MTDPFVPSARARLLVLALLLIGFGVLPLVVEVAGPVAGAFPPLVASIVARVSPMVWYGANVAMLIGVYVEWRRVYRSVRDEAAPGWLVLATAIAAGVPAISAIVRGDASVVLLYATILGFAFALCGTDALEWCAAGVVLALAAAIELPMMIVGAAVVLVFVAREPRRGVTLAISFAAALALWLVIIPRVVLGSAESLSVAVFVEPRTMALFAIGAIVLFLVARHLHSPLEMTVLFGVACIALAGFGGSPLALPFLGAAPLLLLDRGRPRAAQWLAVAALAGVLLVHARN